MSDLISTTQYIHPTPTPPPEPETCYHEKDVVTQRETTDKKDLNMMSLIAKTKKGDFKTMSYFQKYVPVIVKFLKELDGRDKSMKIIQYFIKILLHYHLVSGKQWSATTSHFSMTRKLLRLGNFMAPYKELMTTTASLYDRIVLINAFINSVADDIFCYHKLGFIGKQLGSRAERVAAYCWFAGIIFDLRENKHSRKQLQRDCKKADKDGANEEQIDSLQHKLFVAEISKYKLLMDGIFCACDIWQPSYSPGLQVWTGFLSGSLAGWKLWIKLSS